MNYKLVQNNNNITISKIIEYSSNVSVYAKKNNYILLPHSINKNKLNFEIDNETTDILLVDGNIQYFFKTNPIIVSKKISYKTIINYQDNNLTVEIKTYSIVNNHKIIIKGDINKELVINNNDTISFEYPLFIEYFKNIIFTINDIKETHVIYNKQNLPSEFIIINDYIKLNRSCKIPLKVIYNNTYIIHPNTTILNIKPIHNTIITLVHDNYVIFSQLINIHTKPIVSVVNDRFQLSKSYHTDITIETNIGNYTIKSGELFIDIKKNNDIVLLKILSCNNATIHDKIFVLK